MTFEQALEWMKDHPNGLVQSMKTKRVFYYFDRFMVHQVDAEVADLVGPQKATFTPEEALGYWEVVGKETAVVAYANAEGKVAFAIKGSDYEIELAHEASHIFEIELGQG